MPNFLDLPRELRDQVYELCLVGERLLNLQNPIYGDWGYSYDHYGLTTGLLRVSKNVHREASLVLYSQNIFDLTLPQGNGHALEKIGHHNAQHIRHVVIKFPDFCSRASVHDHLSDVMAANVASMRSHCTHLHTVMVSRWCLCPFHGRQEKPEAINEALALIDSQLRTIPSLRNIMVQAEECMLNDVAKREFASHGWTITGEDSSPPGVFNYDYHETKYNSFDYELERPCGTGLPDYQT
ncbi:hypothetical protein PG985_010509 [Apiospora marii]|uniref:Uncharacterized protein n=1 Tax=Apiospora marii TaxID=335849 RepID=A0ABR1T157_9PEZI